MVPHCGMVEHAYDVVEDLVDGDVRVFPCVDDAGSDVLKNGGCNLAGGCVEDVGKVVLREQRVSRVGAMGIGPGLVLMLSSESAAVLTQLRFEVKSHLSTSINDRGTTCFKLLGDGIDDRSNERGEEREHK